MGRPRPGPRGPAPGFRASEYTAQRGIGLGVPQVWVLGAVLTQATRRGRSEGPFRLRSVRGGDTAEVGGSSDQRVGVALGQR